MQWSSAIDSCDFSFFFVFFRSLLVSSKNESGFYFCKRGVVHWWNGCGLECST